MTSSKFSGMILGLDTTDAVPRIVGLSHGSVVLETALAETAEDLKTVLSDGSSCTAALPPSSSLLVSLRPPELPESKLEKILPSLLDVQLPFPIAECTYTFVRYGKKQVAHAIRNVDLERHITGLNETGYNPAQIVPPAHAAWMNALSEFPPRSPDEPRAVLIGGSEQTILLSGHGQELAGQSVFKTDAAEPPRRLRLAFGGIPDGLVCILTGSQHNLIKTALESSSAKLDAKIFTAPSPEFFLARALAFTTKHDGKNTDSNLRQGAMTHPAKSRLARKPLLVLCLTLAASSLLILAVAVSALCHAKNQEAKAKAMLERTLNEVAGYPIKTKGERAIQDARAGMAVTIDREVANYLSAAVSAKLPVLAQLCTQHGIKLHYLAIEAGNLTASGSAASKAAVDAFVKSLNGAGINTAISEEPKAVADGSVTFFIHTAKP